MTSRSTKHAEPDEVTLDAERAEADAAHAPDRQPTDAESEAAERGRDELADEMADVAEHEREMAARGAAQRGEGVVP